MKQLMKELGTMVLVSTSPLWCWGPLVAFENSKIESREYRDIGNATVVVHRLKDGIFSNGEIRVHDRPSRGLGKSYLVDSDGDGRLDYRNINAGGVNFASGNTRIKPTEADQRMYNQIMGQ